MIIATLAALALQAATSNTAAPPANPPAKTDGKAATTAKPADDPNKQICKRQTPVGSSIEQRVCKTKAQWDQEADNAKLTGERYGAIRPGQ